MPRKKPEIPEKQNPEKILKNPDSSE